MPALTQEQTVKDFQVIKESLYPEQQNPKQGGGNTSLGRKTPNPIIPTTYPHASVSWEQGAIAEQSEKKPKQTCARETYQRK